MGALGQVGQGPVGLLEPPDQRPARRAALGHGVHEVPSLRDEPRPLRNTSQLRRSPRRGILANLLGRSRQHCRLHKVFYD